MATDNTSSYLIEKFKNYYCDLKQQGHVKLHHIYSDDIIFKDPIHEVHGLDSLSTYLYQSIENLDFCRFDYLDQIIGDNSAYIKWDMHYLHPKISKQALSLRGMTHIRFNDKITYHEDAYDVGSLVYEHVPIMGSVANFIKNRMTATVK